MDNISRITIRIGEIELVRNVDKEILVNRNMEKIECIISDMLDSIEKSQSEHYWNS